MNKGSHRNCLAASILTGIILAFAGCGDSPTQPADGLTGADPTSGQGGQGSNLGNPGSVPRFIVQLAPRENPHAVASEYGVEPDHIYTHVLKGFAGQISEVARQGLMKDLRVVSVEKDEEIVHQSGGITQWSPPWGLDRIDQRESLLNSGYTVERTGTGVTAYIVDSGIRFTHQDFQGRAVPGFDAFGGDASDCYGHGTHVAGTVGGYTFGVAKNVGLVSVKVLNCGGYGDGSGLLAGLDWIMADATGPSVANFSLAFAVSKGGKTWLDEAIQNLVDAGITVVAAAANYNSDACDYLPARVPDALTVGSTGRSDQRSSFSNWGRCVDWFAPGESVISASFESDDGRTAKSGTSMAAPHTTGVVALFLEANPDATPVEVEQALLDRATKNVVMDAQSGNDHLLYSLGNGVAVPPPPENQPPVAAFSYTCENLACQFADESSDGDGSVVGWSWQFGPSGTSGAANPGFTFPSEGTYTVSLTVTDDDGDTATTSEAVTVTAPTTGNQLPAAGFSFQCDNLTCQFTDTSGDSDGSLVGWSWAFGSEGTSDQPNPSFTFPVPGTFSVSLTVTDDQGGSDTNTRDVTVTETAPSNQPPTADFSFSCQDLDCTFTDESTDPDGIISARSWSIGPDASSSESIFPYTFPSSGTYTVSITVTDDDGASDTRSKDVAVSLPLPPDEAITLSAVGMKDRGYQQVQLNWQGASGAAVDLFRNDTLVGPIPNTGSYLDSELGRGKGTYRYQVCEADTDVCSAEVEVVF